MCHGSELASGYFYEPRAAAGQSGRTGARLMFAQREPMYRRPTSVNTFHLDEAATSFRLDAEQARPRAARGLTFPAPAASNRAARDVWVIVTLPGGGAAAFAASALAEARERAASLGLSTPSDSLPESAATALPLANSTQMAELIGCNDTLVEQMAKDGRIPCVRAGKLLRFEPAAVIAALRRRSAGEAP